MEKPSVYIETSIVSYLTTRPTNNLQASAWQKATVDWWAKRRRYFDLRTSDLVVEEAGKGEADAAARRLEALVGIPILDINESVEVVSEALMREGALPKKAVVDSLHIAVCAVNAINYLLTWNFRHLANVEMKPVIRRVCIAKGLACPEIGTPQELMGVN